MVRRRLIQVRRKPARTTAADKLRKAALKKAEFARKLAEAKKKAAARAEAARKAAEARRIAARKKAEQAKKAADAAIKKAAEAKRLAAQRAAQAKKASVAKKAAAQKQAQAAKRAADAASKKSAKLKQRATKQQAVARTAERQQLTAEKKADNANTTAIQKSLEARIKIINARNARRRQKIKQRLDLDKLRAEVRKWQPLITQLHTIQKRLSSPKNFDELTELVRKTIPKKGRRKTELSGKAVKIALDDFLTRMKIDINALEKKAARAGVHSTFLLGFTADAAYGIGIEGGTGWAITVGRREIRTYRMIGGKLGTPGVGASVEVGWEDGGPEAQQGFYKSIGMAIKGYSVALSLDIDLRSIKDARISGVSVGYSVPPEGFDANVSIGWGSTKVKHRWSKPQPRRRKAKSRPGGRVALH